MTLQAAPCGRFASSAGARRLVSIILLSLAGCATYPVAGLRPLDPEVGSSFSQVDSLQPMLRWEAFPRPADLEGDRDRWLSRIRDVTYDLRIWKVGRALPLWYPGELIYSKSTLPMPTHMIEVRLEPTTRYLWSVRARFDLDGQQRVTEWGVLLEYHGWKYDPRTAQIPLRGYYHFITP